MNGLTVHVLELLIVLPVMRQETSLVAHHRVLLSRRCVVTLARLLKYGSVAGRGGSQDIRRRAAVQVTQHIRSLTTLCWPIYAQSRDPSD